MAAKCLEVRTGIEVAGNPYIVYTQKVEGVQSNFLTTKISCRKRNAAWAKGGVGNTRIKGGGSLWRVTLKVAGNPYMVVTTYIEIQCGESRGRFPKRDEWPWNVGRRE